MARPTFAPATPERWPDLERLFGPRGACAGCWCMWWKLDRPAFDAARGAGNRRALARIVRAGAEPGLLAYVDGEPAGWVALEPREAYPRIGRSRLLAPAARGAPPGTWAITCFYVAAAHRGTGLVGRLVEAAVVHARARGASAVEAYPRTGGEGLADGSMYTGAVSTFERLGFEVVARPSKVRAVVRRRLGGARPAAVRARGRKPARR